MKVLVITNLYPNGNEPERGVFIRQQFAEISRSCEIKVIAPVPWVPFRKGFFGKRFWGAGIEEREMIGGIEVFHPRWLVIPKIMRSLYGFFMFISLFAAVKKIRKGFAFDIINAQWMYPDGFAAVLLGRLVQRPVIVHALGCDVNLYTRYFIRRHLIVWAMRNAKTVVTVSKALKDSVVGLGIREDHVVVIPNGINGSLFKPMDRKACREQLGLPQAARLILCIGRMEEEKGTRYLLEAVGLVKKKWAGEDIQLVLVGRGSQEEGLRERAAVLGISESVHFAGSVEHGRLPLWINASDVFSLPSIREGMPNVVLEALACGAYIVASRVGGVPEIICTEKRGRLVPAEDINALADALLLALFREDASSDTKGADPAIIDWRENAKRVVAVMSEAIKGSAEV